MLRRGRRKYVHVFFNAGKIEEKPEEEVEEEGQGGMKKTRTDIAGRITPTPLICLAKKEGQE